MFFNDDTTGGNYTSVNYAFDGSLKNSNNSSGFMVLGSNLLYSNSEDSYSYTEILINNRDAGKYKAVSINAMQPNFVSPFTDGYRVIGGAMWEDTSNKVTKISFQAETDSIGVGSRFIVLGRR